MAMPTSASRSAIDCSVGCRMSVLAPWPRTSRCVAPSGLISKAETSPFSGVARNFSSRASWAMSGVPLRPQRMGEAEADAVGVLGEEDAERLAVVLLLVDDPRPDLLGLVLAMQSVDVADGEPAARLLGVLAVDREADLHVIAPEPGRRLALREQREAKALSVVADRRPDLPGRNRLRVGVADRAGGLEEHSLRHRLPPQSRFSEPVSTRAQGNIPAFWSVARDAAFVTLQRAAGTLPIS